jgi:hypothetical protein
MGLVKHSRLATNGLAIGISKRAFLMPGRSFCIRNIRFRINLSLSSWNNLKSCVKVLLVKPGKLDNVDIRLYSHGLD